MSFTSSEDLLQRAVAGDAQARAALFALYRDRLKSMVRLRMDRRLSGRIDASDVVQEAYLDYDRRFGDFTAKPGQPFYLWLRQLAGQRLIDLHRMHLGAQMRDAGREISIFRGMPEASSASLAAQLIGRVTSASQAAAKAEIRLKVQQALNNLDEVDREVLTLRHFEQLINEEVAEVLGLSKQAASNRYVRALKRVKELLKEN